MSYIYKYKKYLIALAATLLIGYSTVLGVIKYNTSRIDVDLTLKLCSGSYYCGEEKTLNNLSLEIFEFNDSYIVYFDKPIEGNYQIAFIDLLKKDFELGSPKIDVTKITNNYIKFKIVDLYTLFPLSLEFLNINKIKINVTGYE